MCSLKATVMCCEVERRVQSLQQLRSFDPSIPSGHLSVNKTHRGTERQTALAYAQCVQKASDGM